MDQEKERKYLKVKKILTIGSFILFILFSLFILWGTIFFDWHLFTLSWVLLCGLITLVFIRNIIRSLLSRETRLVKFFCPNCKEYVSRPRHRPNCLKCNTVMYPVRYCPKCQIEDTVVSLIQWTCYRCGSKLKEIPNLVEAKSCYGDEALAFQ